MHTQISRDLVKTRVLIQWGSGSWGFYTFNKLPGDVKAPGPHLEWQDFSWKWGCVMERDMLRNCMWSRKLRCETKVWRRPNPKVKQMRIIKGEVVATQSGWEWITKALPISFLPPPHHRAIFDVWRGGSQIRTQARPYQPVPEKTHQSFLNNSLFYLINKPTSHNFAMQENW